MIHYFIYRLLLFNQKNQVAFLVTLLVIKYFNMTEFKVTFFVRFIKKGVIFQFKLNYRRLWH
jgi:hypothetical protein